MEPVIGNAIGVIKLAWDISRAAWSAWRKDHPRVDVTDTEIGGHDRAILSLHVTNTLSEPIRLLDARASHPLGASVGIAGMGPQIFVVGDVPLPPYRWPEFTKVASLDIDLKPGGASQHFDVCIRREPLIVFGGEARIVVEIRYETMGLRQRIRSAAIYRKVAAQHG